MEYALAALAALAGSEEGLRAVAAEGGAATLKAYMAAVQCTPVTEDAIQHAELLLAALPPCKS